MGHIITHVRDVDGTATMGAEVRNHSFVIHGHTHSGEFHLELDLALVDELADVLADVRMHRDDPDRLDEIERDRAIAIDEHVAATKAAVAEVFAHVVASHGTDPDDVPHGTDAELPDLVDRLERITGLHARLHTAPDVRDVDHDTEDLAYDEAALGRALLRDATG